MRAARSSGTNTYGGAATFSADAIRSADWSRCRPDRSKVVTRTECEERRRFRPARMGRDRIRIRCIDRPRRGRSCSVARPHVGTAHTLRSWRRHCARAHVSRSSISRWTPRKARRPDCATRPKSVPRTGRCRRGRARLANMYSKSLAGLATSRDRYDVHGTTIGLNSARLRQYTYTQYP